MTLYAKHVIADILLCTEDRIVGAHGPFFIIHKMLNAYFAEWGWS